MKKLQNYSPKNYIFIILFIAFLALLIFAPISSAVVANGVFSYDDSKINIQHFEGGIVEKVLVKNGDQVNKNQEIIRLFSLRNTVDKKIIQWKLLSLILQKQLSELESINDRKIRKDQIENEIKLIINSFSKVERNEFTYLIALSQQYLKASINKYSNEINIFNYKIKSIQKNIKFSEKKLKIIKKQIFIYKIFVDKNILNQNTLFDLQQQEIELISQISNFKNEIEIISNQKSVFREENVIRISQKIIESIFDIKINFEQMKLADDIINRSLIYSPIDGFVENLKLFSSGEIVESGKIILQIVPKYPELIVLAKVKNVDVDNIKINQNVEIFLKNFYEKKLPKITGKILTISKDIIFDENLKDYYFDVRIKIDNNIKFNEFRDITAGMIADVFIKQKNRNIISYILAPIFNSILKSFNEFI